MTDDEIRQKFHLHEDQQVTEFFRLMAKMEEDYEREGKYLEWEPYVQYSTHGDLFKAVWKQDSHYARWHNHFLSTFHNHETHELVGIDVWGFKEVLDSPFSCGSETSLPRVFYNKGMDSIEVMLKGGQPDPYLVNYVDDMGNGIFLHGNSEGILMVEVINITARMKQASEEL